MSDTVNIELRKRGIYTLLCPVHIAEQVLCISSVTVLVSKEWVGTTPEVEVIDTLFQRLVRVVHFDERPKFNVRHRRPRKGGMLQRSFLDIAVNVSTKICSGCKAEKDADEFGRCAKAKDGLQSLCKECFRSYYIKSKAA